MAMPSDYLQQMSRWQAQRLADLLAPSGWLNLTGFGWLKPGENRIGAAADNDIVLRNGPAQLAVVTLTAQAQVWLRLAPDCAATIDGSALREARLFDDASREQAPSIVRFGTNSLHLLHRDGRKAVRIRDEGAAAQVQVQAQFAGLDYYPIDPAWRIMADWMPYATPVQLRLNKRLGSTSTVVVPGQASFSLHGRRHTLLPYRERAGGDLFLVFADQTSGQETYATGRFLYAAPPINGTLVLDFNQAHNPPSAFTPYANCPIAPPENTLALRVLAGEQRYRGPRDPHSA